MMVPVWPVIDEAYAAACEEDLGSALTALADPLSAAATYPEGCDVAMRLRQAVAQIREAQEWFAAAAAPKRLPERVFALVPRSREQGVTAAEIAEHLGCAGSTARRHLRALEDAGRVRSHLAGSLHGHYFRDPLTGERTTYG